MEVWLPLGPMLSGVNGAALMREGWLPMTSALEHDNDGRAGRDVGRVLAPASRGDHDPLVAMCPVSCKLHNDDRTATKDGEVTRSSKYGEKVSQSVA